jgi:nitrite reductase (NO-forming)
MAALFATTALFTPAMAQVSVRTGDIVRAPTDVPPPIGDRAPTTINVELVTQEVVAHLDEGTTFRYWTFGGTVPGPMIRARVGDTIHVTLKNPIDSQMVHNIDFHAATGPGGGGEASFAAPGETNTFSFKALKPGLYVYHCATAPVAMHISNGMYGMILVEPEGGLPPVDHEWYVMQGELYTDQPFGTRGQVSEDWERLVDEHPTHIVFNGAVGALRKEAFPMVALTGETARIYFGVGGPNLTSSIHLIGEIMDKAWLFASAVSDPVEDVQTVTVPPGGAAMLDFKFEVPGTYNLVDHALSRVEKGLLGQVVVEGDPVEPGIFDPGGEEVGEGAADHYGGH